MHANFANALILLSLVLSTSATAIRRSPYLNQRGDSAPTKFYPRHDDPQSSTTIDPSQIQSALQSNGLGDGVDPTTSPAMTSSNNFANFCLSQPVPLTNGAQVEGGSCNPTIIGRIIAKDKIPSCKFIFPTNGAVLEANKSFTVQMAIRNMHTGIFTSAKTNYFANPQTVDDNGFVYGHSHLAVDLVGTYDSKEPTEPTGFAFFKAMNTEAVDGVLSVEVTDGLAPGVYRFGSINTAASHQPVVVAVAQHGLTEDVVYVEVVSSEEFNAPDDGQEPADSNDDEGECVSEST